MTRSTSPIGPIPPGREAEVYDHERRRLLWTLTNGLYLVGSMAADRRNLMTISWITQVATEPKMLAIGVESGALTHSLIEQSALFTLSVLPRAERAVVRKFVKPCVDDRPGMTLNGIDYVDSATHGLPVLSSAVGYFECTVDQAVPYASHTLFVGEVVNAQLGAQLDAGEDVEVLAMRDTRMSYGG